MPAGFASCTSMDLLRSPVGLREWQHVTTPVRLGYGAQFAVSGPNLYLLSGNDPPLVLLYSADRASPSTRGSIPVRRLSGKSDGRR